MNNITFSSLVFFPSSDIDRLIADRVQSLLTYFFSFFFLCLMGHDKTKQDNGTLRRNTGGFLTHKAQTAPPAPLPTKERRSPPIPKRTQ